MNKPSEYFTYKDMFQIGEERELSPMEMFLADTLGEEIDTVLSRIPGTFEVSIEYGFYSRTYEESMEAVGFKHHGCSMHLFGKSCLSTGLIKDYPFTYGAVNIKAKGSDVNEIILYNMIIDAYKNGTITVGNVVLETFRGDSWVHIANNVSHVIQKLASIDAIESFTTKFYKRDECESYRRINV